MMVVKKKLVLQWWGVGWTILQSSFAPKPKICFKKKSRPWVHLAPSCSVCFVRAGSYKHVLLQQYKFKGRVGGLQCHNKLCCSKQKLVSGNSRVQTQLTLLCSIRVRSGCKFHRNLDCSQNKIQCPNLGRLVAHTRMFRTNIK